MHPSIRRLALLSTLALLLLALPAAAANYKIDGTHSSAVFKVKHFGTANFYGSFHGISGSIAYDPAKPAASSIKVAIKAESVSTGQENRDGHIKSPDFLNAAQFPEIAFASTSVKSMGDDKFEITGKLTLHGVTKDITVEAMKTGEGKNPRSGADIIGFEAKFSVDRTAYDMTYMAGPLGEEITFLLSVEAAKEAKE